MLGDYRLRKVRWRLQGWERELSAVLFRRVVRQTLGEHLILMAFEIERLMNSHQIH